MNEREARNTDCQVVREQLATLRGGALLRGPLRRHVRSCEGCRAFRDETRTQRAAMALLLPVVPTAGLKASTMSAALGGSAAAGGAAATATGGGVIAGLVAGGKAGAAKVLVAAAVAGGGIGAGVAEVNHLRNDSPPATSQPGQSKAIKTSKAHSTSGAASAKGANGKANGQGAPSHQGKPTSSPARSDHAATGRGISGTQPKRHTGVTGKDGAPGQAKAKTNSGNAVAKGKVTHSKPVTIKPERTAPVRPLKPPTAGQPSATAKQQPATTDSTVTTVTDEVADTVHGQSQK